MAPLARDEPFVTRFRRRLRTAVGCALLASAWTAGALTAEPLAASPLTGLFGESVADERATFFRSLRSDSPLARRPAQPPTATPGVPAGPPLYIGGEWSITRSYWRSCPGCGTVIVRTVPWIITQSGADVQVSRGLRGTVTGSGPALLTLEGTESGGFDAQRFWYSTLRVAADGRSFEGAFNGSEMVMNPCGSSPPEVTCLVSAGWVRGVLVESDAPPPTETPAATAVPTATETPRPLPPVRSAPSATALATRVMGAATGWTALLPSLSAGAQ